LSTIYHKTYKLVTFEQHGSREKQIDTEIETERQKRRETERQKDRKTQITNGQIDRKTERQTDIDRKTER
jgi:hypothetical protein